MGPDHPADVRPYVPFGHGPTDEVPLEWAGRILTLLKEHHPQIFGQLLAEAIGIERRTRANGKGR